MTALKAAIQYQLEECIKFQVYIPPCYMPDGRKLLPVDNTGSITGVMPAIDFLLYDKDANELLPARFHPYKMEWELING